MSDADLLFRTRTVTRRQNDPRSIEAQLERLSELERSQRCSRWLSDTIHKYLPLLLYGVEKWGTVHSPAKGWQETETQTPRRPCEGKDKRARRLRDLTSFCCEKTAGWLLQGVRLFAGLGCAVCQRLLSLSARLRKRSAAELEILSTKE